MGSDPVISWKSREAFYDQHYKWKNYRNFESGTVNLTIPQYLYVLENGGDMNNCFLFKYIYLIFYIFNILYVFKYITYQTLEGLGNSIYQCSRSPLFVSFCWHKIELMRDPFKVEAVCIKSASAGVMIWGRWRYHGSLKMSLTPLLV